MSRSHIEVKTKISFFQQVWTYKKCSELRLDDGKDYRIGEALLQREWTSTKGVYTGRWVLGTISAITRLNHWVTCVDHRWVIVHLDPKSLMRGKHPSALPMRIRQSLEQPHG